MKLNHFTSSPISRLLELCVATRALFSSVVVLAVSAVFAFAVGQVGYAQSAPSSGGGYTQTSPSSAGATHITRSPSSVQATGLPGGLSLVGQVQEAGSDALSVDFQGNVLPDTQGYYGQDFPSTALANPSTLVSLSPEHLTLATNYDARVYFVGETTDSHNALGFRTYNAGSGVTSLTQLIFPDASSPVTDYNGDYSGLTRNVFEPLLPGDFVDLGTLNAGDRLDFTLLVDAINGGTTQWWSRAAMNGDGEQHAVAFARPNSPYLMIGFEETSASGGNFIDLIYAIDIGAENVAALLAVPEPQNAAVAAIILMLAAWLSSRRRLVSAASH